MAAQYFRAIFVLNLLIFILVDCQITTKPPDLSDQCIGSDIKINWVFDDISNFVTVTWKYIDSSSTETDIMQITTGDTSATIVGGYNVVHDGNGAITLTDVTLSNSGSYKIIVTYLIANPTAEDTVSVTVKDCQESTTPTSTTPTSTNSTGTANNSTATTTKKNIVEKVIIPVASGVLFLLFLCIIICCCVRHKRNQEKRKKSASNGPKLSSLDGSKNLSDKSVSGESRFRAYDNNVYNSENNSMHTSF